MILDRSKVGKFVAEGTTDCEEFVFDDMCNVIANLMKKTDEWYCEVHGFGWMNRDGHKVFKSVTGRSMIGAILPDTECSFKVYKYGRNGIAINNSHHDKPTGGEWYYIVPMTKKIAKQIA